MPHFTDAQLTWLRARFAQPAYEPEENLAKANYRAGRASVVRDIETAQKVMASTPIKIKR